MSQMIRRARLVGPRQLVIERVPKPRPSATEVLVSVKAVGICGTDLHAYAGEHPYILPPIVLGHEASGVVEEVGAEAQEKFRPGQRVLLDPSIYCGKCKNCLNGRFNTCIHLRLLGCQADGALTESLVVEERNLIPLPDDLGFEETALLEPLAVCIHAVDRAGLRGEERVAVFGAGPIGLLTVQLLKRVFGLPLVAVVEPENAKRAKALALGADLALEPIETAPLKGEGINLIFECSGSYQALGSALEILTRGGTLVLVGVLTDVQAINLSLVQEHELSLLGTLIYTRQDLSRAVSVARTQVVDLLSLITHRFSLEETPRAFEYLLQRPKGHIKSVIYL